MALIIMAAAFARKEIGEWGVRIVDCGLRIYEYFQPWIDIELERFINPHSPFSTPHSRLSTSQAGLIILSVT